MARRLRGRPKRMGRLKRFFRRAALTAGIMLGCASLSNQPAMAGKRLPRTPLKPARKCDISKTLIGMHMQSWFSMVRWSLAGTNVIQAGRQNAMIDTITQVVISSYTSKRLVTSTLRLSEIQIPSYYLGLPIGPNFNYNPYRHHEKDLKSCSPQTARDDSKQIARMFNKKRPINTQAAFLLSNPFLPRARSVPLDIVKSDAKGFVLEVLSGIHAGKRVVLDRRIDIMITEMPNANLSFRPWINHMYNPHSETLVSYRITSLKSDKNGNLKATLALANKSSAVYYF